jgi:8-oxo-dGTP pyrophosphatase MutT (NUDIX family)
MTDYSYRNGLREAVAFLLLDRNGQVLLECRPDGRGGFGDTFYPSGSIEMKDHADGGDYRETALRREIAEEFRDGVTVRAVEFLGEVEVPAIGLVFYAYWIAAWSGDPGEHTYEDGLPFGRLRWMAIDEVRTVSAFDSTARMTNMLRMAVERSRTSRA